MRLPLQFGVLLLALLLAACARGPDPAGLQHDVQDRLDTLFGGQVLELKQLKRQGSSPLPDAEDGSAQVVVYYNAVLAFAAPYDPADWQGLSPESIATALGATGEGLIGFTPGRAAVVGSELRAYGSLVYRRTGETWVPSSLPVTASSRPDAVDAAGEPVELVERLAQIVNTTPGLQAADERIVAEELDRALQNITLRLDRGKQGLVVAAGPAGGEYSRFVDALAPRSAPWAVQTAHTAGSVENALSVDSGQARFGLVQSDVAATAVTGTGAFAAAGPLRHLRAVAALFPEPLHVVVRADSDIATIAQLAGRRVAIGQRGSGTRPLARQVLAAHGLADGSYVSVDAEDPGAALQGLLTGSVDAVIDVVASPWQQLVDASARTGLRLLPLDGDAVDTVTRSVPGLLTHAIPARTYAGQETPVPTVAATALLLANSSVPEASVERVLEFLYGPEAPADRGVTAARLSRERAQLGITLPLHDGAARFFEQDLGPQR